MHISNFTTYLGHGFFTLFFELLSAPEPAIRGHPSKERQGIEEARREATKIFIMEQVIIDQVTPHIPSSHGGIIGITTVCISTSWSN